MRDPAAHEQPAPDLLLVVGDGAVKTFELRGRDVVIGRGRGCDIVIEDRSLSRRHAVLRPAPPAVIQDLGSTNGTRVGGVVHHGGAPVALGDGEGFHVGPFAFVLVRRERRPATTSSAGALLCVEDPTLAGVNPLVRDIALSSANILVLGETGVGKEVLAATLHEVSARPGALTRINCAALSDSLLENELFGHEKGAFTGATAQKPGLLETADRGTVFLDEIGEMSLAVQAKLLRVVENRELFRLGATRPTAIDVRFIAATHRDLATDIEAGRFRRDLLFRLDGVELVIPPLRQRRSAIARLARRFLADACARANHPAIELEPAALAALEAHPWPGNVRELKAVIERAVLLARGSAIAVKHLAFRRRAAEPVRPAVTWPPGAADPLADLSHDQRAERARLVQVLEDCAGNQSRAAKQLGISRTTMVTKLGLYRIKRPRA